MKKYIIYFDSGTTNSRVYLLDREYNVKFTAKRPVGSRDSAIEGSNLVLIKALKSLYDEVFKKTDAIEEDVEAIYASGMITSPYGLHEIPHIVLPVTLGEFASHIYCHYEKKLFERNIYLVPGIKTVGDDIAFVNNTRGEEIEALGALADLEAMGASRKIALILPGSHTHVIYVEDGVLTGIISNFTGEVFQALKDETILSPILSLEEPILNPDQVRIGAAEIRLLPRHLHQPRHADLLHRHGARPLFLRRGRHQRLRARVAGILLRALLEGLPRGGHFGRRVHVHHVQGHLRRQPLH